jgi:hypothetical protein
MKSILLLLIFIPYFILSQKSNKIFENQLNDSLRDLINLKHTNIGDTLLKHIEDKSLNLYKVDSSKHLKLSIINKYENLNISYLNETHQIKNIDYLYVYKEKNGIHFNQFSGDSVVTYANGDVVFVNSENHYSERLFKPIDIQKIYYLVDLDLNNIIAIGFDLNNNFKDLNIFWLRESEIKNIKPLLGFYETLIKLKFDNNYKK